MKKESLWDFMLSFVLILAAAFMLRWALHDLKPEATMSEEVQTRVDTLAYSVPDVQEEAVVEVGTYVVPLWTAGTKQTHPDCDSIIVPPTDEIIAEVTQGGDSVVVDLPILQRHYQDSTYEAWVSGPIDPRLDSLRLFSPVTVITRKEWKPPKRWHIGVTAGYGYTPGGFRPFIGIGVTYSLISF